MRKYIMLLGAVLALAACGQSEKEENKPAQPAQSTAAQAQSTATPAQDTATPTQSTATPAQSTATPAQSTIDQNTKE